MKRKLLISLLSVLVLSTAVVMADETTTNTRPEPPQFENGIPPEFKNGTSPDFKKVNLMAKDRAKNLIINQVEIENLLNGIIHQTTDKVFKGNNHLNSIKTADRQNRQKKKIQILQLINILKAESF